MSEPHPEIERLEKRREVLARRLDLIAQGTQLTYDDGAPVDMASEKARIEDEVARIDRKLLTLGPAAGQA